MRKAALDGRPEPEDPGRLSDRDLLSALRRHAAEERACLSRMLRLLAELDRRRLYLGAGYPSLFAYCTGELRLSEDEAYRRIRAARAARDYPAILRMLERGRLTLSVISLLAPQLCRENHRELLARAAGRTKREAERLVTSLEPRPGRRDRVRHLGAVPERVPERAAERDTASAPRDGPPAPAPVRSGDAASGPSAGPSERRRRVEFIFTADESLLRKMERARSLMRGSRMEDVFEAALDVWLDRHDPDRILARKDRRVRGGVVPSCGRPKPAEPALGRSRRIPQAVKDAVYRRDGGRCSFVSPDGRRCSARADLEYDHKRPFASGGASDDPDNIRLLCRRHNQHLAREVFGSGTVDAAILERRKVRDGGAPAASRRSASGSLRPP